MGEEFDWSRSNELLKRPATSEPSTVSKVRLPCRSRQVIVFIVVSFRDIRKIYVAFSCFTIPAKHRINSFWKLGVIRFVDATSVYPEVLEAIARSLLSTEPNPSVSMLRLPRAVRQVFEADLFIIISSCMWRYRIRRCRVDDIVGQAELVVAF